MPHKKWVRPTKGGWAVKFKTKKEQRLWDKCMRAADHSHNLNMKLRLEICKLVAKVSGEGQRVADSNERR